MRVPAVILAAGEGTRMRRADGSATMTPAQASAADSGVKALMPVGRPFVDYLLGALAAVGVERVCLVVAPWQEALRRHIAALHSTRLQLEIAVQETPRGTAHALLAARAFTRQGDFLLLNSDTYYPPPALAPLVELDGAGLVAFDGRLLASTTLSNVTAERLARFALVRADAGGFLEEIVEKPDDEILAAWPEPRLVSVNCWRFGEPIFAACQSIQPSARGELELTAAVQHCIDHFGVRFRILVSHAPILDLSERRDVGEVEARLRGVEVDL